MDYKLFWSDESIRNLKEILSDIKSKWTDKEVDQFKAKLSRQLDLINQNPYMFPRSLHYPQRRKSVLSKQTSIYYEIKGNIIYLSHLHLNRKSIDHIK
jgi:plasmid stabilization system protein ParE